MAAKPSLGEKFLASLSVAEITRKAYRIDINHFERWLASEELSLADVDTFAVNRYIQDCSRSGLKASTIRRRIAALRRYFTWLVDREVMTSVPVPSVPMVPVESLRETLTVAELRRMWDACKSDIDRIVIGLLGLNALAIDEICALNVEDLTSIDSRPVLRLRARAGQDSYPFTVLSEELNSAIRAHVDGRKTGPLVYARQGGRLNRAAIHRRVRRIAGNADLRFKVTPLTLTYSLRGVGITHGFSYVGVMRATGEKDSRRTMRWVSNAPTPITDHAAAELALEVFGASSTGALLSCGDALLLRPSIPVAVPVMLTGAVLEACLRRLCHERQVQIDKPENKRDIFTYVAHLSARKMLTKADAEACRAVAAHRNNADHGRFDRVSAADARWVVSETRRLVEKYDPA